MGAPMVDESFVLNSCLGVNNQFGREEDAALELLKWPLHLYHSVGSFIEGNGQPHAAATGQQDQASGEETREGRVKCLRHQIKS
jgi:hypothetical protein